MSVAILVVAIVRAVAIVRSQAERWHRLDERPDRSDNASYPWSRYRSSSEELKSIGIASLRWDPVEPFFGSFVPEQNELSADW